MDPVLPTLASGIVGLLFALYLALYVLKHDEGTERMKEISSAIKEGALAFLAREYRVLTLFVIAVTIILSVVPNLGVWVGLSFLFGSVCSGLAGFVGMNMAIRSNARTAASARKSLNEGLRVAFRSGGVMGICVVSIGVIGLSIIYFFFNDHPNFLGILPAFGMGASSVAIFARVGGGIYTKAADMGADLVGKVEKNIPEDDPRNAAVIADFVGDNVGDVAGMGADLFESYVDSIIATMTLSMIAYSAGMSNPLTPDTLTAWALPMLVAAGGIVASICGFFFVRVGETPEMEALLTALRKGTVGASILTALFSFFIVYYLKADLGIFWAVLSGLIAGVLIGESTNYYTSYAYSPTRRVSESSQTGSATIIVRGFATGMMSTWPPVILVAVSLIISNYFAGIYGVAISGIGMLSTLGITLATDAYGPVADNAGGIVEMSHLPSEIRNRTDALDSLGNTTAATGKGFAIGSAALTALALMLSYSQAVGVHASEVSLLDAKVMAGLFIGAMLPVILCAMALTAVGKTCFSIVNEVRRQFKEIVGLMEGTARPEYGRCVDICTKAAIKAMLAPGLMTVLSPLVVGFLLGKVALVGFLTGAITSGFLLAIMLANAGGAWDNAKKWIESGNFGGKGSDAHKAGVVGDTVGDPMKDTAGPSLNIMIKLMSIISLVFAPVLAKFPGLL